MATKYSSITVKTGEKIGLVSNLSTMLNAGIPILEAVNSLLEDSKGNVKTILETLRDDLTQGEKVHVSFSKFPRVFDGITINLLKASEEAGTLTTILRDLKDTIRKQMEFTDKIKSALTYPVLILFVFAGMLLLMLVVVVPKISSVFLRLNVPLPIPTQILIFLSNALLKNTVPFLLILGLIVGSIVFIYKRNKMLILGPFFRLPLISKLVMEIDLTRFSHNMFLLLNSGLPIINALELSQEVVVRPELKSLITKAKEMVSSGKKLSEGFKGKHKNIPSIMVKLIEVGDKTGTLDKSMQDVAEYLDYEVTNTLKSITVVLEPIMLVLVGVCIGGMMLAIIAPIYGLIGQVGGR